MDIKDLPQFPEFAPLTIEHKSIFNTLYKKFPTEISEMNFTELFIWRGLDGISISSFKDGICISVERGNCFYPPVGDNQLKESINDILKVRNGAGAARICGVTDRMLGKSPDWASEFILEDDRDSADYVYLTKDLIELKGKKYDGKRNLIKQFKKDFQFEYVDITGGMIPECVEFQKKWCNTHNCICTCSLAEENTTVLELLNNFAGLDVFGAAIRINGVMEAFTVAGELNPQTAVIHIEKANPALKGIYQTINQMFCERRLNKYEFVNREQDMGIAGLRKAKLSYQPSHMVNKKIMRLKE
jgi:hypothetical protein